MLVITGCHHVHPIKFKTWMHEADGEFTEPERPYCIRNTEGSEWSETLSSGCYVHRWVEFYLFNLNDHIYQQILPWPSPWDEFSEFWSLLTYREMEDSLCVVLFHIITFQWDVVYFATLGKQQVGSWRHGVNAGSKGGTYRWWNATIFDT